jgi:hypothetical protein
MRTFIKSDILNFDFSVAGRTKNCSSFLDSIPALIQTALDPKMFPAPLTNKLTTLTGKWWI